MWGRMTYRVHKASLYKAPLHKARRARRGLGLLDAILAAAVFAVMLLLTGQVVGDWAAGRATGNDARAVAELARQGRLLIDGDVSHPARTDPVGAAPREILLSDLTGAGLRSPVAGSRTPGRRALTLWAWRHSDGAVLVIARARGDQPIRRLPDAGDGVQGVGALIAGFGGGTTLAGAGVRFDMAPLNTAEPGFARPGSATDTVHDLFALDYVAQEADCRSYLYRVEVDCDGDGAPNPEANSMAVDLDMGDNNITQAGQIEADRATIPEITGPTEVTGELTVANALTVGGLAEMQDVTVRGALTVTDATIAGGLSVETLTASGEVTGADLTFDGTLTVSGEARLGEADAGSLNVTTLNVRQLSADEATISDIFATDVIATQCTGCAP